MRELIAGLFALVLAACCIGGIIFVLSGGFADQEPAPTKNDPTPIQQVSTPDESPVEAAAEVDSAVAAPKSFDDWAKELKGKDSKSRLEAVSALAEFGNDAIPILIVALEDSNSVVRTAAIEQLQRIGSGNESVTQALLSVVQSDKDGWVCSAAVNALANSKAATPEVVAALITAAENDRAAYSYGAHALRDSAFAALQKIGPAARTVIPRLLKIAGDESSQDREKALATALQIGFGDKEQRLSALLDLMSKEESTPSLTLLLLDEIEDIDVSDRMPFVTCLAERLGTDELTIPVASLIGEWGKVAKPAVPALVETFMKNLTLSSKEEFPRRNACAVAIGRIAHPDESAIASLRKFYESWDRLPDESVPDPSKVYIDAVMARKREVGVFFARWQLERHEPALKLLLQALEEPNTVEEIILLAEIETPTVDVIHVLLAATDEDTPDEVHWVGRNPEVVRVAREGLEHHDQALVKTAKKSYELRQSEATKKRKEQLPGKWSSKMLVQRSGFDWLDVDYKFTEDGRILKLDDLSSRPGTVDLKWKLYGTYRWVGGATILINFTHGSSAYWKDIRLIGDNLSYREVTEQMLRRPTHGVHRIVNTNNPSPQAIPRSVLYRVK